MTTIWFTVNGTRQYCKTEVDVKELGIEAARAVWDALHASDAIEMISRRP